MFDPIKASENIKDEYISYILTSFHLADKDYEEQFRKALTKGDVVYKGPYLDINDSFETGKSITEMIKEGEMSPLFEELEPGLSESEKEIKLERRLYKHQENAIRKINRNKNLVVTTGTGSGKTECFVLPVINHLLREKESSPDNRLNDGVRAIIIYPMNALANDQMKRFRSILKNYPDITFGVYNSSTKNDEDSGKAEYKKLFKDQDGKALEPLPNEVLSRERMRKNPPHILITNYAMLEYMMLRPKDDGVFSGSDLKFLILDEAHIYKGATGIETSLLLRRLKARIKTSENLCHILTSATLGGKDADNDIINFASTLCSADFCADDIIRSKTMRPSIPDNIEDFPVEVFEKMSNSSASIEELFETYGINISTSQPEPAIFYDLCLRSRIYSVLRKYSTSPLTISDLVERMNQEINISEKDLVNFINIASKAEKNKSALIKARYHMFIRALDGVYITIDDKKELYLVRRKVTDDSERRVFEAAVCDDCGRIGVTGRTVRNRIEQSSERFNNDTETYLIVDKNEEFFGDDDDGEYGDTDEIGEEDYLICSECGEIHHKSQEADFECGHGVLKRVPVRRCISPKSKNNKTDKPKCPCCGSGKMRSFYLGYDAATAVLGTELFEQLPETEVKIDIKKAVKPASSLFASSFVKPKAQTVKKKRQFLAFSDSRSEAAYFACYMTSFYKEFLRRRGIWHVINKNKEDIIRHPWEISTLISELTSYFDENRTFAEPGDNGTSNLTTESRHQAWIAVLNEMVNAGRSTSLSSLGVLRFSYKGNTDELMQIVAENYGKKTSDIKALFDLLVMDIVYNAAIRSSENLTDDEKEYIYYTSVPRYIVKQKDTGKEYSNKNSVSGWVPRTRTNGKIIKNNRAKRLMNMLGISESEAVDLLSDYWDNVLIGGLNHLENVDDEFYFKTDNFVVMTGNDDDSLFVCDTCGKPTMINCMDRCVSVKCDGHLRPVSRCDLLKNNHYVRLYSEDLMAPLHIKEHTAQLGRVEQQKYQKMFVDNSINALSCSTTFEMGVDVGDLETVYMRNMPPSPSNYVQRAGRAGRSIRSSAFSLTYAKLGSHDFSYYENPEKMIAGKIGVPIISVSNEKITRRHIYAVALSSFFAIEEEVYNGNNANVFLNEDGYEKLVSYLNEKPENLKKLLLRSIPKEMHSVMGIENWSWIETLIGKDGVLNIAVNDYRETVKWYEEQIERFHEQHDSGSENKYSIQLRLFRRAKEDKYGQNDLIEFLVRNNVLPKYGFPVDTVELYQGANSNDQKLQMVRDLQLAVAEYAPGSQVVADGKLYTSRYIRKLPQAKGQEWDEVYICQCSNPNCKTWNYSIKGADGTEKCVSCGKELDKNKWQTAIEPRKGFIAESKTRDVPLRKPERSFRSDDYYIGDVSRKVMMKKTFVMGENAKIQTESSSNDSLLVVCNDQFFVCDKCGFALSTSSGEEANIDNKYKNTIEYTHKSPWGKDCKNKLTKKRLCHSFKTDVVTIKFGTERASDSSVMLSVMYALLAAVSEVLEIERTDIKGCLNMIRYENKLIYEIVLYDAVAGGAGYVRKLVTDDGSRIYETIRKAMEITGKCSCDPSCYNCLRNYYNQAIHDQLNRFDAYNFLAHFSSVPQIIPDEQFEDAMSKFYDEEKMKLENGYSCSGFTSWEELYIMLPESCKNRFVDMDTVRIPLPSFLYCKCQIPGTDVSSTALMIWKKEKIMVFEDKDEPVRITGWKSLKLSEIALNKFQNLFNGGAY